MVAARKIEAIQHSKAPPLDGEGLGRGGLGESRPVRDQSTPTPPSPIEGEGLDRQIWQVLAGVADPEIPVLSVVDLGIVREVDAREGRIAITPTYTGCPATVAIQHDIRAALDRAGFRQIRVETILSPPWTTAWISEEGKRKLRDYGIAPPNAPGERRVACPQCGSAD